MITGISPKTNHIPEVQLSDIWHAAEKPWESGSAVFYRNDYL